MKIGLQLDTPTITPAIADALNALAAAELEAHGQEPATPAASTEPKTEPNIELKPPSKADLRKDAITAELEDLGATPPPRKSSVKVFEESLERAKTKAAETEPETEPEAEPEGDEWDEKPEVEPEVEPEEVSYDYTKTHALAKKVVLKHEPAKVRQILDEVCGEGVGLREVFDSGDNKKIAAMVKAFEKASGSKY